MGFRLRTLCRLSSPPRNHRTEIELHSAKMRVEVEDGIPGIVEIPRESIMQINFEFRRTTNP